MKKLLVASILVGLTALVNAESVSIVIPANTMTNIVNGPTVVNQVLLTSANTAGTVQVRALDNNSDAVLRINPAYTTKALYLTNWTEYVTNYFGLIHTNLYTNMLYTVTNQAVAATTNSIAPVITASVPAATTVVYSGVDYKFLYGMWVTNTSASNVTVTVTHTPSPR